MPSVIFPVLKSFILLSSLILSSYAFIRTLLDISSRAGLESYQVWLIWGAVLLIVFGITVLVRKKVYQAVYFSCGLYLLIPVLFASRMQWIKGIMENVLDSPASIFYRAEYGWILALVTAGAIMYLLMLRWEEVYRNYWLRGAGLEELNNVLRPHLLFLLGSTAGAFLVYSLVAWGGARAADWLAYLSSWLQLPPFLLLISGFFLLAVFLVLAFVFSSEENRN